MNQSNAKTHYSKPDANGKFGEFGGAFVSETLMPAVLELQEAYKKIQNEMKKNKIPTHKEFIESLSKFLIS